MIRDKRYGALPDGAAEMTPDQIAPLLVAMQNDRVELTERHDSLRTRKDELAAAIDDAKRAAEGVAMTTLDPARGKDTPAASAVKAFVDADATVVQLKRDADIIASDYDLVGNQLGSVRSGLRVLTFLGERDRDASTDW